MEVVELGGPQSAGLASAAWQQVAGSAQSTNTGASWQCRIGDNGYFPGGNFMGTVGYAPFHNFESLIPADVEIKLTEIQQGLADGSIDTGVSPSKP